MFVMVYGGLTHGGCMNKTILPALYCFRLSSPYILFIVISSSSPQNATPVACADTQNAPFNLNPDIVNNSWSSIVASRDTVRNSNCQLEDVEPCFTGLSTAIWSDFLGRTNGKG